MRSSRRCGREITYDGGSATNTPRMIVDAHGRRFRNLRVSLTAACNYACTYCVPNGKRLQAAVAELGPQELLRAVRLLIETAGIDKLRITGGEPLLSPKFDDFLPGVMDLPLKDVSVTTNGQFLPQKARAHRRCGSQAHQRQPRHSEPRPFPRHRPQRRSRDRSRRHPADAGRGPQGQGQHGAAQVRQRGPDPADARLLPRTRHRTALHRTDEHGPPQVRPRLSARLLRHGRHPRPDRHALRVRAHRRRLRLHLRALRDPRPRRLRHHRQRVGPVLRLLHAAAALVERLPLRLPVEQQAPRHDRSSWRSTTNRRVRFCKRA